MKDKKEQIKNGKEAGECSNKSGKIDSSGDELAAYEFLRSQYPEERFRPTMIQSRDLKEHNISFVNSFMQQIAEECRETKPPDVFFNIIQAQFHGLQYTYEIVIGPFKLKILVLNLLRDSDEGEEDPSAQQVGSGSFGTVTQIKLKSSSYAIKRIPFHFKLQPEEGYDFQQSKREQQQLRLCLKQFCFYKIFSLLNIGPKIVNTGYDLVCFNNCIEFKMQLCQPMTNDFFSHVKDVNLEECQQKLWKKLLLLHSMNIVHRDIKPENILYSPSQNQLVFGDFGMALLLREGYKEKTLTKFVGTPTYCGEQMKNLLNGGSGMVNLYINDFHSLQLTVKYFQGNIIGQNSNISSNSMSYNSYSDSFSEEHSFQSGSGENSSESPVTDHSVVQTRNSLATLPTTSTLAPKKHAFLVNHFISQIIYNICRLKEKSLSVPEELIHSEIVKIYPEHENQIIQAGLRIEIGVLFLSDPRIEAMQQQAREWKNSSRHYGPEHENTINQLSNVIELVPLQVAEKLKSVQLLIINYARQVQQYRIQLLIYEGISSVHNFVSAFISYLRHATYQRQKRQCSGVISNQDEIEDVFIARKYISCIYRILSNNREARLLTRLIFRYFSKQWNHENVTSGNSTGYAMKLCYLWLKEKGKASPTETLRFICYEFQDVMTENWGQVQPEVASAVEDLLNNFKGLTEAEKALLTSLIINLSSYKNYSYAYLQVQKYRSQILIFLEDLISETQKSSKVAQSLKYRIYKSQLLQYSSESKGAISECLYILSHFSEQSLTSDQYVLWIENLSRLSIFYINEKKYVEAQQNLQKALSQLQLISNSLYRPKFCYNISYNLIMTKLLLKKYLQALKGCEDLIDFLLKSSLQKKCKYLVNCLHLILTVILANQNAFESWIQKIKQCLTRIIYCIFGYFKNTTVWQQLKSYYLSIIPVTFFEKLSDSQFAVVYEHIIQVILSRQDFFFFFRVQLQWIFYNLGKHYTSSQKLKFTGMKYLWRCIKLKLIFSHPSRLTQNDYQIILIYAQCLVNSHSNRVAIRFLNHFIQHIPEMFFHVKVKFCQLMYRALQRVANPRQKLFYELTKSKCKKMRQKMFVSVVHCTAHNVYERVLIQKWLKKLFFVQLH